jgi:hypothetical protein
MLKLTRTAAGLYTILIRGVRYEVAESSMGWHWYAVVTGDGQGYFATRAEALADLASRSAA